MKKVIMLAAVVAALAACQSKGNKAAETQSSNQTAVEAVATEKNVVYEGTLPAADGPGVKYVLTMTDGTDGTYTLEQTYIDAEGAGKDKVVTSKGTKTILTTEEQKVVKLTPEDGSDVLNFLLVDNNTLRMVNDQLEEAASGLNYDLVKKN